MKIKGRKELIIQELQMIIFQLIYVDGQGKLILKKREVRRECGN